MYIYTNTFIRIALHDWILHTIREYIRTIPRTLHNI